jgi:hypothetical protein
MYVAHFNVWPTSIRSDRAAHSLRIKIQMNTQAPPKIITQLMSIFLIANLWIASSAWAGPVMAIRIGPINAAQADIGMVLTDGTVKKCAGTYRGVMQFFEAPHGVKVTGLLKTNAGACELTASLPWADLPEKLIQLTRSDMLQVRFKGELMDGKTVTKVNWMLPAPMSAVLLTEPLKNTVQRFAKATDVQLGSLSLKSSTVNADITVQSPLVFDLRVLHATCELEIHGKVVATGIKENFILNAKRTTSLRIPVTLNHKALLSATGNVLTQMGKVEGKLVGWVRVKLPGGDVDLPLEFPIKLTLL